MNDAQVSEISAYLREVPFFSEVEQKSLRELCRSAELCVFDSRELVFDKGDEGDAMYVVLAGRVRVHDGEHTYDNFGPGDCFGEYALIDSKPRSAAVTTEEQSRMLRIHRDDFVNLMAGDIGFSQGILAVMIKRHRELDSIQERLSASNQALETAHARMKGLIDGAMDVILTFDNRFRIVLANPAALLVLENDDVLSRNILFFLDEDAAAMLENQVSQFLEKNRPNPNKYLPGIIKVIGSQGRETLGEGTLGQYMSGGEPFFTLIFRNIEERLQAENQISMLTTKTAYLEGEIRELTSEHGILAEDQSMIRVLRQIEQVAPTDATVLIQGETGTGKELVARAIHQASRRRDQALIRVNCGAIPANLIESELFGHKKGAFTGATEDRQGRFHLADKGTIFLDEIGELPLELQPKLLRVIQEGEFEPVGSSRSLKVDVRILAATHRNLPEHIESNKFREDLYYRLHVFPIEIPPLRERGEDVLLIASQMLRKSGEAQHQKFKGLSAADKKLLLEYHWPGNVRELQNLIERAVIISPDSGVDLSLVLNNPLRPKEDTTTREDKIYNTEEWHHLERENILRALRKTAWKISGSEGAARLLGLPPTTLASRIKALGLHRPV